jgi:hypothetical protein
MSSLQISDDHNDGDVVVCMRLTAPLILPDNIIGICAECGCKVQLRPHVPKILRVVCVACVSDVVADNRDLDFGITSETLEELKNKFLS